MLAGRRQEIHAERDRKLEAARKQRRIRRKQAGFAANETRHVNTAPSIADTDFVLPAVIALEYLLAPLKSRLRLHECLPVPLRYREALESSPGMRRQRQGSPPR